MTLSGSITPITPPRLTGVLIPLLLDDPLWEKCLLGACVLLGLVLIPLLLDDPLWGLKIIPIALCARVLIPLLLDDPLWANERV